LLEEGHCLRDQALDVCAEVGVADSGATRAASLSTLVQLVAGGIGVTLLPETAVAVDARAGSGLEARRFDGTAPSRRIGLVYRSSSARAEEFGGLAAAMRDAVAAAQLPVRLVTQNGTGTGTAIRARQDAAGGADTSSVPAAGEAAAPATRTSS
jgi:LysR family hydrogen peroxide-inducible transcriptional activator